VVGRVPNVVVTAAREGDQEAWTELYRRHAGRLVTWLRWLPTADAAWSAEDVAAQAWLTAASKIGEFSGSDDDFAGWLFAIARRHSLNHYRRGVRRRTSPSEVDPADEPLLTAPVDELGEVEDHDTTRRLLAHLSPREAEVITCVDVVGLDVRSAAAALGMNPTAVRVARHRGLNRLRKLMAEQPGETLGEPELG
jgi:RNA polymerase sigma-70 factor, ECF subfamily